MDHQIRKANSRLRAIGKAPADARTIGNLSIYAPDEIGPAVEKLARRIASFPADAVRLAKQSVNQSDRPLMEGLFEEAYLFDQTLRTPGAKANMRKFLEIGGQTREGELRTGDLAGELGEG